MKFSIRDLFWLTLVVACCVLWWMDRVRLDRLQRLEAERQQQADQVSRFLIQSLQSTTPAPAPSAPVTLRAGQISGPAAGEGQDPDSPPDMLFRPLYFPPANPVEPEPKVDESQSPTRRS